MQNHTSKTALKERNMALRSDEEVRDIVRYVQAGMALAGDDITDPGLLSLLEQFARGEITGDEFVERADAHQLEQAGLA